MASKKLVGLTVNIAFLLLLCCYFVYHILNGDYGILAYHRTNEILLQKQAELRKLEMEISRKQNKIDGLKGARVDLDLLDEEIKRNMGYTDPNEIVIYLDNTREL